MRKFFKKLFLSFVLSMFVFSNIAYADFEFPRFWEEKDATTIQVVDPYTDVELTNLTVTGVFTFSGTMGGDLDMNGNDVDNIGNLSGNSTFIGVENDFEMLGNCIGLDADTDSSICADTDDQIDVEIGGADDFTFTPNVFAALAGSSFEVDTISETTVGNGVAIDNLKIVNDGTTSDLIPPAGDYLRIGDAGTTSSGLNSEDDLLITGDLEVDGTSYFSTANFAAVTTFAASTVLNQGIFLQLGTGALNQNRIVAETVQDALVLGLNGTQNLFVITSYANTFKNHGHTAMSAPSIIAHSGLDPDTDDGEFLALNYLGLAGGTMETDRATFDMTIQSVAPFATATGTNRDGADIVFQPSSPTNSGTVYGIASVGANTNSHNIDTVSDSLFVGGQFEVDNKSFFDDDITLQDDIKFIIGDNNDVQMLWETADTDSNAFLITVPEGDATDASVVVIGDMNAIDVDLGLFDGITNPNLAVLSDDNTKAIRMGHDGTGGRIIQTAGALLLGAQSSNHTVNSNGDIVVRELEVNGPAFFDSLVSINSNGANTGTILTLENTAGDIQLFRTDATPEGSVTGSIGDLAIDGTGGQMYVKNSGSATNTGWLQLSEASSEFASMYLNANGTATTIETADTPIGVRLFSSGVLDDWTFDAGSTGAITAYADAGGGNVTVTSASHGLVNGDLITIRGTTNYNGVFTVADALAGSFTIIDTWVADDGASDWDEASYMEAGANSAGTYSLDWNISTTEGGGAGSTVLYVPYLNATAIDQARIERKFANNDVGAVSGGGDLVIAVGDRVYMTEQSSGTNALTNSYGSMRMHRL